jgi:acyl carrier protein
MSELNAKALEVFRSALAIEGDVNTAELVYNEFPGWDSVGHMSLIAGLETAFDCMLEMEEILEISSFQKAMEIIGRHHG